MFDLDTLVLGLAFDPGIRGILSVAVGMVVLYGSVQLILSTNLGSRLGFLVAMAGFFGWMVIMGAIWWGYGIGFVGEDPTWEPTEIVFGDVSQSGIEDLREEPLETEWAVLPADDPSRGEAQASAEEALNEELEILGVYQDRRLVPLAAFERGGKEGLPEDPNRWDRIYTWLKQSVTPFHPVHYAVIQFQPAIVVEEDPEGLAPLPPAEPDPTEDTISVVLTRDLGNKRLVPAMVTIGSLVIFLVLSYALHVRDQTLEQNKERAAEAEKAAKKTPATV